MLTAFLLGASVLTFFEFCDIIVSWLLNRDCCNSPKLLNQSLDGIDAHAKSLDTLSRTRANRTPSFTTDSLQSRDYGVNARDCNNTPRDVMRDCNSHASKRPYVKFHQMNHVRGSGSEV